MKTRTRYDPRRGLDSRPSKIRYESVTTKPSVRLPRGVSRDWEKHTQKTARKTTKQSRASAKRPAVNQKSRRQRDRLDGPEFDLSAYPIMPVDSPSGPGGSGPHFGDLGGNGGGSGLGVGDLGGCGLQ
jgi:hypothetical protein